MARMKKKAKVTKEDEIKAMQDLWKIYGEDITEFSSNSAAGADRPLDPNIKRFLDDDPPISKLNRTHIALLTAIHARRRRDGGKKR